MSTTAERVRALRERRKSAGLRTDGKERLRPLLKPKRKTEHHAGMSAEKAKEIGLESILWLAGVQRKRAGHLIGVHARAIRLPPDWWMDRAHWPIDSIITAAEQALPLSAPVLTLKIE